MNDTEKTTNISDDSGSFLSDFNDQIHEIDIYMFPTQDVCIKAHIFRDNGNNTTIDIESRMLISKESAKLMGELLIRLSES